jgi:hypothetical protein
MYRVCRCKTFSPKIIAILRVLNKHPMVHFTPHHPNERQEMLKTVEQAFFN